MNRNDTYRAGRHSIRIAALTGASLAALSLSALAQDGATRLNEISVAGQGAQPLGGAPAGGPVNLPPSALGTAGGRLNPPASALGKPGQESPVGPVNGYVATRSATGTKTNTSILETPQSISVVGQEQIRATGAQTLTQALQYTPGIYAGVFGNDARLDYFLLRGFVASDYGLYKDGLQLLNYGFNYFRVDPFGLERIEVLRGPSSVLFGSGNPGGMVNQITKRPTTYSFGYVEAGGDSFGQAYGAFDIGGPVGSSGQWFYRLTGIGRTGGTQINGVDADRAYIAPALTYRPDGGTSFTLLTSYQKDWTGVTSNFLPYDGTVRPNASGLFIPRSLNVGDSRLNRFQREQFFVGYEFEHAVDNVWTLRQNARYGFSEVYQNSFIGQLGYANAAQTQLARYQFKDTSRVGLFQVDNQAQADFSDGFFRHTMLFGVDYKHYTLHDNQASAFPGPPLSIVNPVYTGSNLTPASYLINKDTFQQVGLYFQDQVRITENFSIIGGLRQDFARNEVMDKLNPLASTSRNDQALTGRVAGVYNFDWGLAPYIAYSTSFQPQIGIDAISGVALRPDEGEQVEAGFRIQPPGQGWLLSFAAFDLDRSNPPIPVTTGFGTTQLGSVRSRGVEAQFVANVFDGLNVVASVTHYDLKYTKSAQRDLIGKTPTAVPETFANVFADYTIPTGPLRGFGFGGGVRYVGSSFASYDNSLKVPDYVLYDATVHYDFLDGWRAAVTAANIGDKRFVSSCQNDLNCFYGEARRVMGSLSYKW